MSSRSTRRPRLATTGSPSPSMQPDSGRRSVKLVKVLCDGCERASASVYCTDCSECACHSCAEQLHVRGRRIGRRPKSRTCKGLGLKDLQKAVGVIALCTSCRTRPACRFNNGEVYGQCKECRLSQKPPPIVPAHDVVKRAIAAELKQSQQQQQQQQQQQVTVKQRSRTIPLSSEDDSTGDDANDLPFSRASSTE